VSGDDIDRVPEVPDVPDVGELLALVEQLDTDNERLRMKVLELMEEMEETVTAQVAAERHIDELREQLQRQDAELRAVHTSKLMRFTAPLRRAYARLRSRT
jgi:predicted  nucleic acid-binding Zn-ribbon protein